MSNADFHLDQDIRIDNRRCAGIVIKDGKILLIHRIKRGFSFYVFPGGHMDKGEEKIETLKRELNEETSLTVKNIKPAFDLLDYYKSNFDYYFICEWEDGVAELSGEEKMKNSKENHYELLWVTPNEIEGLKVLPQAAKELIVETLVHRK